MERCCDESSFEQTPGNLVNVFLSATSGWTMEPKKSARPNRPTLQPSPCRAWLGALKVTLSTSKAGVVVGIQWPVPGIQGSWRLGCT